MSKNEKKFFRDCPKCGKQLGHVKARGRDIAVKLNRTCKSCVKTGRTHSTETRAKLSAVKKGIKFSPEHIAKLSAAKKGAKLSAEHKANIGASGRVYKKSVKEAWTEMYGVKAERNGHKLKKWAKEVKERDNYTCNRCNSVGSGKYIHAHHIVPCDYFLETALDVSNGITLCSSCHRSIHCDLNSISLEGTKLSPVGFQEHAARFIADGKASSQSGQTPPGYTSVFSASVNIVKE